MGAKVVCRRGVDKVAKRRAQEVEDQVERWRQVTLSAGVGWSRAQEVRSAESEPAGGGPNNAST